MSDYTLKLLKAIDNDGIISLIKDSDKKALADICLKMYNETKDATFGHFILSLARVKYNSLYGMIAKNQAKSFIVGFVKPLLEDVKANKDKLDSGDIEFIKAFFSIDLFATKEIKEILDTI